MLSLPTRRVTVGLFLSVIGLIAASLAIVAARTSIATAQGYSDPTRVSLSSSTYVVNQSAGTVTITVNLNAASASDVSVNYATSDGTAIAGTDYTAASGTLMISAGNTSTTFTVTVSGSAVTTLVKDFSVSLSGPTNAVIGRHRHANVTIVGDDTPAPQVSFVSSSYLVSESAGTATVGVALNYPSTSEVQVDYTTGDGTAVAGTAYTATSGTLTFAAGQTYQSFTVPIIDQDLMDDSEDAFSVYLSAPSNATLGSPSTATVTIVNDDLPPPNVYFRSSNYSVRESAGTATVVVKLNYAATSAVEVNYATGDGTAVAGTAYTATSGTLTFAAGQTYQAFTVPIIDQDLSDDSTDSFSVYLSDPTNATLGCRSTATVTIINDDGTPPDVYFRSSNYSVSESAGTATVVVKLNYASDSTVEVDYTTGDGTAVAGTAYTATSGTLTFTAGQTWKSFTVPIIDQDLTDGSTDSFSVYLSDPTNATLGCRSTATVTIINDDVPPPNVYFRSSNSWVRESAGTATVVVKLNYASDSTVDVDYTTGDGTAVAGTAYTATSGTLTFTAGQTWKSFTVPIIDQDLSDGSVDSFYVYLSDPTNATLGCRSTATVTIDNDDDMPPDVNFSSPTYSVSESAGTATVVVQMNYPSDSAVEVDYATGDSTAVAGTAYTATSGTLTFTAGQTYQSFTVPIIDQELTDYSEDSFYVYLSDPTNATLGLCPTTIVSIVNDDLPAPDVYFSSSTYWVRECAGTATVGVTLNYPSTSSVEVNYTTGDGTAVAGTAYTAASGTLTFTAGQTSQSFTVPIIDQDLSDGSTDSFNVYLSDPENATLGSPSTATVTIDNDDDMPPNVYFRSCQYSVSESAGTATVVVKLNYPSESTVEVDYTTGDGTAVAGTAYTATSGTLTFAAGQTHQTFTVPIIDQGLSDNSTDYFYVYLSDPTNATLGSRSTATVTIVNDDLPPVTVYLRSCSSWVNEFDGTATVAVKLNYASTSAVEVNYTTGDGTAVAGTAYTATSGTLTFAAGQTYQTFTVPIIDQDLSDDSTDYFYVYLSDPVNAALGRSTETVTIINDDDTPPVAFFSQSNYQVGDSGVLAEVVVELSYEWTSSAIEVNYATSDGTALANVAYVATSGTLTFAPGQIRQSFFVPIITEDLSSSEAFNVKLSAAPADDADFSHFGLYSLSSWVDAVVEDSLRSIAQVQVKAKAAPVHIFWVEGASPTKTGGQYLKEELIEPLQKHYKDEIQSKAVIFHPYTVAVLSGEGIDKVGEGEKVADDIRAAVKKNPGKVVLIGYSWGGYVAINALMGTQYKNLKQPTHLPHNPKDIVEVDWVYLIDPVDNFNLTKPKPFSNTNIRGELAVHGAYKKGVCWYQHVDTGSLSIYNPISKKLVHLHDIHGVPIADSRFENIELGIADFTNLYQAHIEMPRKKQIRTRIETDVDALLPKKTAP